MAFIDDLEKMLLSPRAKVYHGKLYYKLENVSIFQLGCYRNIYREQNSQVKKDGILAMMNALRNPESINPNYQYFSLDLISWDYFNEILELNPTYEELFNLYKITGFVNGTLWRFLDIIENKDWAAKFFKNGYCYIFQTTPSSDLKCHTSHLNKFNFSDDEWIELLSQYIYNSIGIHNCETTEKIIDVFIDKIKNKDKCRIAIEEILGVEINFDETQEKSVKQLTFNSYSLMKKYSIDSKTSIDTIMEIFINLLNQHRLSFDPDYYFGYYKNKEEQNIIVNSSNSQENFSIFLFELMDNFFMLYPSDEYDIDQKSLDNLFLKCLLEAKIKFYSPISDNNVINKI